MLHLFWFLLNSILLLYLIHIIIGYFVVGDTVFPKRLKYFPMVLLFLLAFQTLNSYGRKDAKNTIRFTETIPSISPIQMKKYTIEERFLFTIDVYIYYDKKEELFMPIEGKSHLNGLTNGFGWEMKALSLFPLSSDKKQSFEMIGVLKWNLLGITLYRETIRFSGKLD